MANYVHIENNSITEYHDKLPHNWQNISGLNLLSKPELLAAGWYWVENLSDAHNYNTHYIAGYTYEILEDYVKQIPQILAYTEEELTHRAAQRHTEVMTQLRQERNRKLAECDWTQLGDIIEIQDTAWANSWKTYRQQLRDLPATYGDTELTEASAVIWPTPPQG